jgi:multisubunit Na+/H+ antiporter MnhE subunit
MKRLFLFFILLISFIKNLIVSNVQILLLTFSPTPVWNPAFEKLDLPEGMSLLQCTVLAHMITASPGTVSVDLSSDRRTLLLHVLCQNEQTRLELNEIKTTLIRRICNVF